MRSWTLWSLICALEAYQATAGGIGAPIGAGMGPIRHEWKERSDHPPIVAIDFQVKREAVNNGQPRQSRKLRKRDGGMTEVSLVNYERVYYLAPVDIGTPSQTVHMVLDTGSSDTWAMAASNPQCSEDSSDIASGSGINCTGITFDADSSSSWKFNDSAPEFWIQYSGWQAARGRWGTDVIKLGDIEIQDANVALGENSNSSQCVFGIGFVANEGTIDWDSWTSGGAWPPPGAYDNVPVQMKQQGVINRVAYSLWLNEAEDTGTALFGGVDHAKYDGQLQLLPVVQAPEYAEYNFPGPLELNVVLNTITGKNNDGETVDFMANAAQSVLIDSGAPFQYLPQDVAQSIAYSLGAYDFDDGSGWYVDCSVGSSGTIEYDLSGVKISVPISEMLLPLYDEFGALASEGSIEYCQLGVVPLGNTASQHLVLGAAFMRAAYVVFDLEANEIAFAQAKTGGDTGSDIEIMSTGVPSATQAPGYSSTSLHGSYSYSYTQIFTAANTVATSRTRETDTTTSDEFTFTFTSDEDSPTATSMRSATTSDDFPFTFTSDEDSPTATSMRSATTYDPLATADIASLDESELLSFLTDSAFPWQSFTDPDFFSTFSFPSYSLPVYPTFSAALDGGDPGENTLTTAAGGAASTGQDVQGGSSGLRASPIAAIAAFAISLACLL